MMSLILFFIAAILNAAMDMNFNQYNSSIFSKFGIWWNPYESWRFKWKNGDINQGERFFGSSTFLVWMTDSWHLIKMLFLTCIILSIIFYKTITHYWYLDLIIYAFNWFISFESIRNLLKIKK